MLTKLIGHEMRQMSRIMPLAFIPPIFFAILLAIVKLSGAEFPIIMFSSIVSFLGFAVMYFAIAYCVVRFYKSVYGAEGYLTMTLPVTEKQVYASRIFASLIWMVLGIAVMILCYGYGMHSIFTLASLKQSAEELAATSMMFSGGMLWILVLGSVIGNISVLLELCLCVTLAHVRPFRKLGLGAAVLSYIAIYTVGQLIATPLTLFVPFSFMFTEGIGWRIANVSMWSSMAGIFSSGSTHNMPIGLAGFLWYLFSIIITPVITLRLMRRKINLK